MTSVRVSLVDVYVIRAARARAIEFLALRRSPEGRCPGAWETVHGHLVGEEGPVAGAVRELKEEAGLTPERLYNLSRVEAFYRHAMDEVALIPVFAAMVSGHAAVELSEEHDRYDWVPPEEARRRFAWPREQRAVTDVLDLLGPGSAGSVEDVLLIDPSLWYSVNS